MQPAIPVNSRLRIRVQGHEPNRPGDVVFFRTGDDYMVHRVAYRVRHWSGRSFLLTCGDARLAADAPLDESQVLGIVISIRTKKVWRDPGPAIIGSIFRKATRALTLMIMIVVTSLSVPAASRMAALLLRMELVGRSVVRRIRRAREIGVQPQ